MKRWSTPTIAGQISLPGPKMQCACACGALSGGGSGF